MMLDITSPGCCLILLELKVKYDTKQDKKDPASLADKTRQEEFPVPASLADEMSISMPWLTPALSGLASRTLAGRVKNRPYVGGTELSGTQ